MLKTLDIKLYNMLHYYGIAKLTNRSNEYYAGWIACLIDFYERVKIGKFLFWISIRSNIINTLLFFRMFDVSAKNIDISIRKIGLF